jgi:cellulose synthase/poly-beta-1,6-N-acetylglucosamine synthase-like glycosyltransferase
LILAISLLFALSLIGILLVFLLNPLIIWVLYLIKGKKKVQYAGFHPSVSLLVVVHNAEDLLESKIKNSLSLQYPSDNYEIVIFSDGSTDGTADRVKLFTNRKVKFLSSPEHKGKNSAINEAIPNCEGEIIVFSDVDAILESDAIIKLTDSFSDSEIGGACGLRIICEEGNALKAAQSDYIRFDSTIKKLESDTGSISSNDGKLYAIRKDLFQNIPSGVTDDLYVCLSVVKKHYRFIFESGAKAFIKVPSRSPHHEVLRRRRIVSTSLRGIFLMKGLLNPFNYGIFSVKLFVNKILRRLLPIFMILLLVSSLYLSYYWPPFKAILFLQIIFYAGAFSYWALFQNIPALNLFRRLSSQAFYFCIGNFGTFLGLLDFLMGRQMVRWEPVKHD